MSQEMPLKCTESSTEHKIIRNTYKDVYKRQSLTTMLERMENQGLISRVQSETDKRKTLLFLTEKAHALKGEYLSLIHI